ncbi:hypothetical protein ACFX5K_03175 [Rickettsiales bacterium LUAb2]
MQKYSNSFTFRFNSRKDTNFDRSNYALEQIFGKKFVYKELIAN